MKINVATDQFSNKKSGQSSANQGGLGNIINDGMNKMLK
jgi:hypothetical protein